MPITVVTNELPRTVRRSVAETIVSVLGNAEGNWKVALTSDAQNNGWDVEVSGPQKFHWTRRFSGDDRDAEVIVEAMRSALKDSGHDIAGSQQEGLNDALSSLAIQGIAFTETSSQSGERKYVVDRVQLRESELVYLHHQGALTTHGIQTYLLTRDAA
jgi:hypothetical protein